MEKNIYREICFVLCKNNPETSLNKYAFTFELSAVSQRQRLWLEDADRKLTASDIIYLKSAWRR